jgi:hypothetical protein
VHDFKLHQRRFYARL